MSRGWSQCRLLFAVFFQDPDEILLLPETGREHGCLLLLAFLGGGGIRVHVLFARGLKGLFSNIFQKDCFQIFFEVPVLMCSSQILAYSLDQRRGINNCSSDQDHVSRRTDI